MMLMNNILLFVNGELIIVFLQDVVLGFYYLMCDKVNGLGEGMVFISLNEVEKVYCIGNVEFYFCVKVCIIEYDIDEDGNKIEKVMLIDMIVGCVIFLLIFLKGLLFEIIN